MSMQRIRRGFSDFNAVLGRWAAALLVAMTLVCGAATPTVARAQDGGRAGILTFNNHTMHPVTIESAVCIDADGRKFSPNLVWHVKAGDFTRLLGLGNEKLTLRQFSAHVTAGGKKHALSTWNAKFVNANGEFVCLLLPTELNVLDTRVVPRQPGRNDLAFTSVRRLAATDGIDPLGKVPTHIYDVDWPANTRVQVDMTSTDFDTYLRIEDSAGNNLASDDDSGGSLNARLALNINKGRRFRIYATSYKGTGTYRLTVTELGNAPPMLAQGGGRPAFAAGPRGGAGNPGPTQQQLEAAAGNIIVAVIADEIAKAALRDDPNSILNRIGAGIAFEARNGAIRGAVGNLFPQMSPLQRNDLQLLISNAIDGRLNLRNVGQDQAKVRLINDLRNIDPDMANAAIVADFIYSVYAQAQNVRR